jgi:hypothetical protein
VNADLSSSNKSPRETIHEANPLIGQRIVSRLAASEGICVIVERGTSHEQMEAGSRLDNNPC